MGKRYGRNQKRAHREAIARLSADLGGMTVARDMEAALRGDFADRLRELESKVSDWDTDIQHLLGQYSAFLINIGRLKEADEVRKIPIFPRRRLHDWSSSGAPTHEMVTSTVVELKRLVITSEFHDQALRQIVRLAIERPCGGEELHFAYSVDGRAMKNIGSRDYPYVVRAVARELYQAAEQASLPTGRRRHG